MFSVSAFYVIFLFSALVSAIGHLKHDHQRFSRQITNATTSTGNGTSPSPYDYVVVGSGAGGGPLAARLALAGYKVLLIDAGDDQGAAIEQQVPALQLQSTEYTPQKWDYFVTHYQDSARQQEDSKMTWQTPAGTLYVGANPPSGSVPLGIYYPRAGTLGGCSAHNAMISIYPHESDWSNIQSITGDSSWAPANMRKYFQRLEKCEYLPNSVVGHGFSGWYPTSLTSLELVVEDRKLLSLIVAAGTAMGQSILSLLVETVVGLGEVLLRDINAGTPGRDQQTGLYQVPIAVTDVTKHRSGTRDFIVSVANAVKSDGTPQYHLDIQLNTLVTKVRFLTNGTVPKAIGVDWLQGQSLYRADPRASGSTTGIPGGVNVTREVILSAGAFNTPQLLKLSGIGPTAELQQFGIPVLANLPGVGTNLQDRYENTVIGQTQTPFTITKDCTFLMSSPDPCLEQWENNPIDKGTYATNGIAIAVVKKSSVASGDPDLLISGAPANFRGYFPGYANDALKDALHWAWITLKAHARNNAGTVTLRSADPRDVPQINFNYFDTGTTAGGADQLDLQASYEGVQYSRQIFKDLIPLDGSFKEVWPGPNVTTEAEVKDFIKREAWGHHASCTCPIGANSDPMAVLDSQFRVRGVSGLRVVDASVFPKIPGFYIAVPIYMISEKAADVILQSAAAAK